MDPAMHDYDERVLHAGKPQNQPSENQDERFWGQIVSFVETFNVENGELRFGEER